MPRRTNKFQQVIFMVKSHLSSDAVVTESALLLDKATGYEREVDVIIESNLGGHRQIVKIECRDHKRRQNVSWIDEMWGKHRDLPIGVLVLASSSGFTKQARLLADKRQIELLELDSSAEVGRRIAERVCRLSVKSTVLDPKIAVANVESQTGDREQVRILPEHSFYLEDGRFALTGHDVVQKLLKDGLDGDELANIREADPEQDSYIIDLNPAIFMFGNRDDLIYLYMLRAGKDSSQWKVASIQISGTFKVVTDDVNWSHGKVGDTEVSYGDIHALENNLLFVATNNEGVENLSVRTGSGTVIRIE